jgi:hypothetical protein
MLCCLAERSQNLQGEKPKCGAILTQRRSHLFMMNEGKMKERPIIFSTPMVKAILEGRKTQTRRILKRSTEFKGPYNPAYVESHRDHKGWGRICPYGSLGDILWVREAWACRARGDFFTQIEYRADGTCIDFSPKYFNAVKRCDPEGKYRPSIHLPRWAARIFLKVTDVRVQRLQEISTKDAIAEGIKKLPGGNEDQWMDYPEGSSAAGWLDMGRNH